MGQGAGGGRVKHKCAQRGPAKGAQISLCLLPSFAHVLLYQGKGPGMLRKTKRWFRPRRNEMRNGGGKEKDANTHTTVTLCRTMCLGLEARDLIDSEQLTKTLNIQGWGKCSSRW